MKTKIVVIDGVEVEVKVCQPSRRRASSSIQKPKFQKSQRGAKYVAAEGGQFKE